MTFNTILNIFSGKVELIRQNNIIYLISRINGMIVKVETAPPPTVFFYYMLE